MSAAAPALQAERLALQHHGMRPCQRAQRGRQPLPRPGVAAVHHVRQQDDVERGTASCLLRLCIIFLHAPPQHRRLQRVPLRRGGGVARQVLCGEAHQVRVTVGREHLQGTTRACVRGYKRLTYWVDVLLVSEEGFLSQTVV